MLKREEKRWMETDGLLIIFFFQHLNPDTPEAHVDTVVTKFTYVWLLTLLTKQFFYLFIGLSSFS